MTCIGSLSCQSFGPQPFQIFAQRDLLLFVFGQRAIRWTGICCWRHFRVYSRRDPFELPGAGGAIANGIAIRDEQLDRERPRPGAGGLVDRGRPATARRTGASGADQPQVKIGLGGRVTRAIWCLQLCHCCQPSPVGLNVRPIITIIAGRARQHEAYSRYLISAGPRQLCAC